MFKNKKMFASLFKVTNLPDHTITRIRANAVQICLF